MKYIGFAGGGSGGHTYPLLAVVQAWREKYPSIPFYFVTTKGGVEEKIYIKAGYSYFSIPSGKIAGQAKWRILLTLLKLPLAMVLSFFILLRKRPVFVLSAGGYAGAPFLVAAAILRVPCGIFELNRTSGLANRWMSFFAKIIFVHFPETKDQYGGKSTFCVGSPCRKEIIQARWAKEEQLRKFQADPFYLFVFGGSQGAMAINRLVLEAMLYLRDVGLKDRGKNIFVHHQTGERDFSFIKQQYESKGISAKVEPYIYDMASVYRSSHLVICRAGAGTLVELAAAAKPAILIPLVSKDRHQEFNAEQWAAQSAVKVLYQKNLKGEVLAKSILEFYNDRGALDLLASSIVKQYQSDAEQKILSRIEGYV